MFRSSIAAAALVLSSSVFAAPIYEYANDSANTGGAGDWLDSISMTWDAGNEVLNWSTKLSHTDVDSFWLVVNDGPNPKATATNELVIMYGDLSTNTVTSMVYNGANNANSYSSPGIFLQTDVLNVDGNMLSFSIDASAMNARTDIGGDYRGLVAGPEKVGIWYHLAKDSSFSFDNEGAVTSYDFGSQVWYDRSNLDMTAVPEPGSLALLLLGAAGMITARRSR